MTKNSNALWFFVALIGGGITIWLTKSLTSNAWIAAMVAAGVILGLIVYYLLNEEDAPEEEGDNVYYLGLLFTLISLIFSLVELFGIDSELEDNSEEIRTLLENFGIALSSTVVGIAGRVVLQNWQRSGKTTTLDIEEFPKHPKPSAFHLGRIARELTQGTNALARFHRIVRSHSSDTEQHLRDHSEMLKRESIEFKDTLQKNADSFGQEMKSQTESALQAMEVSLGAVVKQSETFMERLQLAHEAHLAKIQDTTHSFHDEIQSASGRSLDAVRESFEVTAKEATGFRDQLQSVHESYLAEIRETTRSLHDDIRSTNIQNLDSLQQSIEAIAEQAQSVAENLSTVNEVFRRAAEALSILAKEAEARDRKISRRRKSGRRSWIRRISPFRNRNS